MALSEKLIEILACPQCKGRVVLSDDELGLVCEPCRLIYRVRDGIPVMLVDEAERVAESGKRE